MAVKTPPCQEWSIREQLCLASAVMRSGDQNWMSVSRAIKPFPEPGRPADWNTPKNCAIQYSAMLNEVDTPKRKRSGDKGDTVETPGDLIVKKMTFDRVEELKHMLADDRRKFKLLRDEIELIESGALDEKLPEILQDIQEKKRRAEEQKLAEEAAAAELLAKREEPKKLPVIRNVQQPAETDIKDKELSLPSVEKKPSEIPVQTKQTPPKVKEGENAKDIIKTTPSTPKQTTPTPKQTTPTPKQIIPTPKQIIPTPVLLPKLLISEKKEEKKETITKEQLSDIEAMLAKPANGKASTTQPQTPAPGEKEIAKTKASKKETPTLSKLLMGTLVKSYTLPKQPPSVAVEVNASVAPPKTKSVVTPKVPIVVEPEPKEEVQVTVVEESSTVSPAPSSQLQIPGLENEDSSDVSLMASTAPSSPAPTVVVAAAKPEEPKKRKRGRPSKKKIIEEDVIEVRSICESADETKDGARSEAAESEETERPSESDRDDASLSNAPISFFSESLPNSPASQQSEDHLDQPHRQWKKAIMLVWREAASHKYANLFLHPVTDEIAPEYTSTVHRRMDLSTIKKNIECGAIRAMDTFQRDIMLMFQNAIMYNRSDHDVYRMACDMQTDVLKIIEEFISTQLLVQNPELSKSLRVRRTADAIVKEEEKPKRSTVEVEHASGKKRKTRADEV